MAKPEVWRYVLQGGQIKSGETILEIPAEAEVLAVRVTYAGICIWVRVDHDRPKEKRTFRLAMTGDARFSFGRYLDTLVFGEGTFVLHAFYD